MGLHLYLGNKNYSSWSLRPWLTLRWAGIAFSETVIALEGPRAENGAVAAIGAVSPTGKVPALRLPSGVVVWDSLAICEWAAEQAPALWPTDPDRRALARSAVAEMHSGFAAVRRELSMNLRRRSTGIVFGHDVHRDLARLFALWRTLRAAAGPGAGPWLCGSRGIVDAFFAPVYTRLRSYGVDVPDDLKVVVDAVFADADFLAWERAALAEPGAMPATDALHR